MKPILGSLAALVAGAAYAGVYLYSVRPGAGWLDMQWVFLAALPYNWTLLRLTGRTDFTPDSAVQLTAAGLFVTALAFLIGALAEVAARAALRALRRPRRRA